MGISNFNKSTNITSNIDTSNFKFTNLEGLYKIGPNEKYRIIDLYINNHSKFGPAPVVVIDGYKVNLPTHLTDTVKDMLKDDDTILQINRGEAGFFIREYESHSRKCYTVCWIDM